ncbi:MAG: hypothetical protein ACU0FH_18765 [Heliomarina sp.]|uniref:hypothetical protein n=1 Tax=Heliomarina sp. TaxID=2917556 RepID=UPI00405982FD
MLIRICLCLALLVTGCGRPLTRAELAFATSLHGEELNVDKVRLVEGAPVAPVTFHRKARPRTTCRERILPPVKEGIVTAKPAAMTLFNKVYFVRDWFSEDFLSEYPELLNLTAAMLLGHELTHVWQWQNRQKTGYSPLRAAAEHGYMKDPYLFELEGAPDFLQYGYEQQGAIVEEYICCRALDPAAARTKRLHDMLRGAFPVADLPQNRQRERDVLLPWRGAELRGICS